ncbi:response regulator [Rhizobium sp. TRM95111]|uniref:response regulator n=1 Tax=Rhizobium alarense TaxID=2846851 RepID=UPI001F379CE0|nr:response regulator [Rhizobium alarense]MCF3640841.1 response regulator [Rhizobium alarense]
MSLSTRIAPHLPYLRRFSRAVTGSQTSGDAYVAAMLEALVADITLYPQGSNDRIGIFRLYCALFDTIQVTLPQTQSPFGWERQAAANLGYVAPAARKAFLLVAVEGFDLAETADILDVPEEKLKALLDEAARDISLQVATDVLIIEDEPLIAMDIEDMVRGLGHRVTGIARTHAEAVELFRRDPPGLVLADIQLADGSSGIDAVNEILKNSSVPVIFITAFPERLLTGEKPEPAFLVTKPFNPEMVKALISQALFFDEQARLAKSA